MLRFLRSRFIKVKSFFNYVDKLVHEKKCHLRLVMNTLWFLSEFIVEVWDIFYSILFNNGKTKKSPLIQFEYFCCTAKWSN